MAKGGLGLLNIRHYINALKLIWIRKLKTSDHKWKSTIKSVYPQVLLFEQLRSSLPTKEHHSNKFWCHVFKAYKEFGKKYDWKIQKSLLQSVVSAMITFGLETELFFRKAGLTIMSAISNIF